MEGCWVAILRLTSRISKVLRCRDTRSGNLAKRNGRLRDGRLRREFDFESDTRR